MEYNRLIEIVIVSKQVVFKSFLVVSEVPELNRKLWEACRDHFLKFLPNPRQPLPLNRDSH